MKAEFDSINFVFVKSIGNTRRTSETWKLQVVSILNHSTPQSHRVHGVFTIHQPASTSSSSARAISERPACSRRRRFYDNRFTTANGLDMEMRAVYGAQFGLITNMAGR